MKGSLLLFNLKLNCLIFSTSLNRLHEHYLVFKRKLNTSQFQHEFATISTK